MSIGYTSLLALVQPVDGTEVGTWGDDVNNGVSSILDVAIAGTQTLSTDANVTLTITQATSSGTNLTGTSAQYAIILLTGARTAARTVTLPSSSKIYVVINQTTGGYATTFKGAATTGVAIVPGVSTHIAWNGSDFQGISSVVGSLGFVDTNILASYQSSVNSYSQIINQNSYNGSTASADFIVTNNLGTASTYYGDFGMNSSGFTGSGAFNAANTVYLTSTSGDLALGTTTSNAIHFVVNGGTTDAMTISSAGAVSLPGGTANGVAYLNGSNVLTTGSALVFDGTNLGVGTSSPVSKLHVNNFSSATTSITIGNNNGGTQIGFDSSNTSFVSAYANSPLRFGYNSGSTFVEAARFNSSGQLGIGTTSPSYVLDVNGGTVGARVSSTQYNDAYFYITQGQGATVGNRAVLSFNDQTGATSQIIGYGSSFGSNLSSALGFATNGTVNMTLNSSGNLGVGVTPSSYLAGQTFQINRGTTLSADVNSTYLSTNSSAGAGSGKYMFTGNYAVQYSLDSALGAHKWYTAPSGTAGNAISFTQAMTLDSSGNLLVGLTTASTTPSQGISLYGSASSSVISIGHASGTASGNGYVLFAYNGSLIGSITQSGTTGVLYNITSDQRLKTDLGTVTSTDVIANTVIHDFTWKTDGSQARGVFAQEAAKVLPAAVKVGDDGEEVTDQWQVDYSKYVPDIIVELQSLRARVAQLEAQKG